MTHQELLDTHEELVENLSHFFGELPQDSFSIVINEGWSVAEHVAHLTHTQKVLAKALAFPKTALALRFGKRGKNIENANYDAIVAEYRAKLKTGFKAPQDFEPKQDKVIHNPLKAVESLQEASQRLTQSTTKWDDTTLDTYVLPHPAFKQKLSIQEMLSFDLYHSLHHRNNVAKELGLEASWPI